MSNLVLFISKLGSVAVKVVSACPEKDAAQILSDSDHLTKVAPTILRSI